MSIAPDIPEPPKYNLDFDLKTYCQLSFQERKHIINQNLSLEEALIWQNLGVTNTELIKGWKQRNLSPQMAVDWYNRGYLPYEVDFFLKRNKSPEQADELISIDEKQTIRAQKFPPILLSQIAEWKEYDFNFEEALIWLLNFWVKPDKAREWCERGFSFPEVQSWLKISVTQPITAKAWLDNGLSPTQVKQWQQIVSNADPDWVKEMIDLKLDPEREQDRYLIEKMRPASAIFWQKLGFQWSEIKAWLSSGFVAYRKAARWREAGFSPSSAKAWRIDDNIIPEKAREWSNIGLNSQNFASWYQVFQDPQLARVWLEANFTASEAKAWNEIGLISPKDAQSWIDRSISLDLANWALKNGISSRELSIWLASYPNGDFETLNRLYQWRKNGAGNAETALKWDRAGLSPEEFQLWKKSGLRDPQAASQLIWQGYTPKTWQKITNIKIPNRQQQWLSAGEAALLFWGIAYSGTQYADKMPWDGPESFARWQNRFLIRSDRNTLEKLGCKVDLYGRANGREECLIPYITVIESEQLVIEAGLISTPIIKSNWYAQLQEFCTIMSIPWSQPSWYLAAAWGEK